MADNPSLIVTIDSPVIGASCGSGVTPTSVIDNLTTENRKAALSAYQGKELAKSISDVNSDVSALESKVSSNTTAITTANASIATNTSDIADLKSDVSSEAESISVAQTGIAQNMSEISAVKTAIGDQQKVISNVTTSLDKAKKDIKQNADDITVAKKDISSVSTIANTALAASKTNANNISANASGLAAEITRAQSAEDALDVSKIDGAYVEDGYLYLTANGVAVVERLGPFSGGGGGGGGSSAVTVTNKTGWLSTTISDGSDCFVTLEWSSVLDELPTGDGTLTVSVGSVVKLTQNLAQGEFSLNLKNYLSSGTNKARVTVTDVYGSSRTVVFTVTVVAVGISSTFDGSVVQTGAFSFYYIPVGAVAKTVYIKIDGSLYKTVVTSVSGQQLTETIPSQTHGAHLLEVYFKCTISGAEVESNHLKYSIICVNSSSNMPIIASTFDTDTVEQYDTISVPYQVYDPAGITTSVTLTASDGYTTTLTVDRGVQSWSYRPDNVGEITLTISCGEYPNVAVWYTTLTVTESTIPVEPVTDSMTLHLSSYGRSNSEASDVRSTWEYTNASGTTISSSMTGFSWSSDGWVSDEDGITVCRVAGDARVEIPLKLFKTNCTATGKTIEIEFDTHDVMNYDAVLFDCMSGDRGLKITAQRAYLASRGLKMSGGSEFSNSCLSMQYKENEHIRLAFVISKEANYRLVYAYINGIISGLARYPANDDWAQTDAVNITIGSSDCAIDLYNIRVYENDLTREQVLNNWIADTQVGATKKERYNHNNIFNDYGAITIDKLPSDLPYMIVECAEMPQKENDEKTVSGSYVDPLTASKCFTFTGASAKIQGTSSVGYPRKNYKIAFSDGFVMTSTGQTVAKYAMSSDSIPVDTFTFKADYASCEGANNVELVDLYNLSCPYKTVPQKENEDVRQGIEGHPMLMFWSDGTSTTFLGKYNFNNDKGTADVFGFESGDESWETKENTTAPALWKEVVTSDNYSASFETRYPKKNETIENLAALSAWIVSTDTTATTGDALPKAVTYEGVEYTTDSAAYRLAKFKAEFEDHLNLQDATFYYIFTELFLMIDSRAKNSFPTLYNGDKWVWLPYDMDTALGINNEGLLKFDYNLEDTDMYQGAKVYNGQDSVLWNNFRDSFQTEISEMYAALRSGSYINYDYIEEKFETHQHKWPEAVFNEDAYFKYIQPLIEDNTDNILMCQGSKEQQRKWWLYNRLRYIDSKYAAGDASGSMIMFRAYQRPSSGTMEITPYADIYTRVAFDANVVKARATRNVKQTVNIPTGWDPSGTDAVVDVYSADQLKSIGDLSGFYIGYNDFSKAERLQELKVGDSSSSYSNQNLTTLTLGANTLLKVIDARNCVNLNTTVDASQCTNIEEIYLEGTAVPGVSLNNGSTIKVLHLPSSVSDLTLRNCTALTDFVLPFYENITTLWLENYTSAVDAMAILESMAANSRVRLVGISMDVDSVDEIEEFYTLLETMRGMTESGGDVSIKDAVSGTINIDEMTGAEKAALVARFPSITINAKKVTCNVYFYNGTTLLQTKSVLGGADVTYTGSTPTKSSTAYATYTFAGWGKEDGGSVYPNLLKNVQMDIDAYAEFTASVRTYTVTFVNSSGTEKTLQTVTVNAGSTATYTGTTPTYEGTGEYGDFIGWNPSNANILANTTCYAQFKDLSSVTLSYLKGTIKHYESETLENVRAYAFNQRTTLTDVSLPAATSIGGNAFQLCSALTTVSLPAATSIGGSAFQLCSALTTLSLPAATSIGGSAFRECTALTELIVGTNNGGTVCTYSTTSSSYDPGNANLKIYVPDDLVDSYKAATNWSRLASKIYGISEMG